MKEKRQVKSKFLFSILVILFTMIFLATSVVAEDIVYVAKDSLGVDSNIINILNNEGYTYDIIYKSAISSTNFSRYDIILVGEGNFGADALNIPVNERNAVILNTYHLEDWNWMDGSPGALYSNQPKTVNVLDEITNIREGVANEFFPYSYTSDISEDYKMYYIRKAKKAPGVNTVVADGLSFLHYLGIYVPKNGAVVASVSKGALLENNNISNSRGVFIGFPRTNLWTEDSEQIFVNSLWWAVNGDDKDGDGFRDNLDCNDNDPEINPNAEDIPYDNIDQDCDGTDLNDLDEDGFISDIVGGDDCNDNNPYYNPGSPSLSMNCINDPPIIYPIPKRVVMETENAEIIVYAEDPEDDELEYSINDSRFGQEDNYFVWETNYNDSGEYTFFVYVSDGEFTSEREFVVDVRNNNKPPKLILEIPEQEWEEDTNHTLNLSEYFYDLDGDDLYYFFSETSEDTGIILEDIDNQENVGLAYFSVQKDWYGEDWIIFKVTDRLIEPIFTYTNNITLRILPVDDEPYMLNTSERITMWENQEYELDLSDYFVDVDGDVKYSCSAENVNFEIQDNILKIIPEEDWFGQETFNVSGEDSKAHLELEIDLEVMEVVVPFVESFSPEEGALFNDTRTIEFNFSVNDKVTEEFDCELVVDNKVVESMIALNNTLEIFEHTFGVDGIYSWKVKCENIQGNFNESEEKSFEISAPDVPIMNHIGNKQVHENNSLEFTISGYDLDGEDVSFSVKNAPEGSEFTDNLDGTASFLWQTNYELSGFYYPEFFIEDTTGLKTSEKITIKVVDVREPPKFEDAKRCTGEDYSGLVEIKIREPDYEDEFEIGEIINVEFEIENNFDEDLDFDYEVHLYDLVEEESLESIEDEIEVEEGEDEKIELELEIPDDFEESEFAIYLYVESEDNYCNSDYVEINIERKEHDVRIKDIKINPEPVAPGQNMEVRVSIENLGTEEEDVIVEIEIPELGVSDGTEEFEIEEYGEDDSNKQEFKIEIPSEFKEGSYELTARVIFDDEKGVDEKTVNFAVLGQEIQIYDSKDQEDGFASSLITLSTPDGKSKVTGSTIQLKSPENNKKVSKNVLEFKKPKNPIGIVATFLLIGIVVLSVMIFIIIGRR